MNKNILWHPFALLLAVTAATSAFAATSPNVLISFVHSEQFTDFKIQDRSERETAVKFVEEMSPALAPTVARQAPGCTLSLRFTDIDLGGRYEPRLGPRFDQIRFYHDGREPVRLYFNYTLTDPSGRVLLSGSDAATNALYLDRYPTESIEIYYEEFFFEKQTLISWMRNKIASSSLHPTIGQKR